MSKIRAILSLLRATHYCVHVEHRYKNRVDVIQFTSRLSAHAATLIAESLLNQSNQVIQEEINVIEARHLINKKP